VTTPIRFTLEQVNTSVGRSSSGVVPRSLSAPSSCCFSQGMKKSMIESVPSVLTKALTAASSRAVGGCLPGTAVPESWDAYPFPVAKNKLEPSYEIPPPLIQTPPPFTVFASGPPWVAKISTTAPVVLSCPMIAPVKLYCTQ
jgi:hypothetical protein